MAKRAPVRKPFVMITAALAVGCGARFDIGDSPVTDTGTTTEDARPETLPAECPRTKPTAGTPCASETLSCDYSRCYAPYWEGGDFFFCNKGVWTGGGSSCNPPPPDPPCPIEEPQRGASCTRPSYSAACKYPDKCPSNPHGYPYHDYSCVDGKWQRTSPEYTAKCPGIEPTNGSTCLCGSHYAAASCDYGDCYGTATTTASCIGTAWSVSYLSCNPPPPVDAGAAP